MINPDDAVQTGISAALAAGEVLKAHFQTDLQVETKSSPRDYVTEVDGLAQQQIIEIIRDSYPDHRFIAEEKGADDLGHPQSPYAWIIDPLDGTTNYIHGKPDHGTLIALQENGELILGVMYTPLTGDLYFGTKGGGSWLKREGGDPKKLGVRKTNGMMDAILSSNITHRAVEDPGGYHRVNILDCASLHNYGVALKEMGDILLGQNDGVYFEGVGLWDVAAASILIAEAGGKYRIENIDRNDIRKGVRCVASTKEIFDILSEYVFDRDS